MRLVGRSVGHVGCLRAWGYDTLSAWCPLLCPTLHCVQCWWRELLPGEHGARVGHARTAVSMSVATLTVGVTIEVSTTIIKALLVAMRICLVVGDRWETAVGNSCPERVERRLGVGSGVVVHMALVRVRQGRGRQSVGRRHLDSSSERDAKVKSGLRVEASRSKCRSDYRRRDREERRSVGTSPRANRNVISRNESPEEPSRRRSAMPYALVKKERMLWDVTFALEAGAGGVKEPWLWRATDRR